jgi:AcrR family transcriptional regulator
MSTDWTTATPAKDRRVRRSRAALIEAAVALVSEQESAAVPVSDLAEAADVSRQVLYQQFGDRDTLLLEAALDLVRRELLESLVDISPAEDPRVPTLAVARHFAEHRRFYRALLNSSVAFGLNKALTSQFLPLNRRFIKTAGGEPLDPQTVEDLATFMTGGAAVVVNTWVVDGPDPLDPEEFTDRLIRMWSVVSSAMTQDEEPTR